MSPLFNILLSLWAQAPETPSPIDVAQTWQQKLSSLSSLSFDQFLEQAIGAILRGAVKIAIALAIFFIGKWIINRIHHIVAKAFVRRDVELSLRTFLLSLIRIILMLILIVIVIGILGINTSSFLALFASAGLAVGMALSGTLQNFAGGVLILLLKPFRTGDYIVAQGQEGSVKEINLFNTVLATPDNKTIIIPNGSMSNSIVNNVTDSGTRRIEWTFGIAYGDDYDRARQVLQGLIDADERIFKTPASLIALSNLADSVVQIVVRAWVKADDYWSVFYDMNEKVYKVFPEHGLTIPFNQLDVNIASLPSPIRE